MLRVSEYCTSCGREIIRVSSKDYVCKACKRGYTVIDGVLIDRVLGKAEKMLIDRLLEYPVN